MRTVQEQIEGLAVVANTLVEANMDVVIVAHRSDVVSLATREVGPEFQVVYAVDGYDLWGTKTRDGNLISTDLTAEQAAKAVLEAPRREGYVSA